MAVPPLRDAAVSRAPSALDATEPFLALYREVAAHDERHVRASLPSGCYECDYLFMPGLLTHWNNGYFAPNLERLAALGLAGRIHWAGHPMGSIARNAEALAKELGAAPRPVVVLAHSKGALETWAALVERPELAAKVRAFVAIQSPVFGSEVADWYRATPLRSRLVRTAAGWLGGSEDAVWDMTTPVREAYVARHPFPVDKVPTVSLVTTFDRSAHRFYVGRRAMAARGADAANDGMVAVSRGVVPGGRFIALEDMDHLDPVSGSEGLEQFLSSMTYDAANLTEALLRLIF